ncbi:MAG: hypothetical protein V5789_04505 [Colwellia sp.]
MTGQEGTYLNFTPEQVSVIISAVGRKLPEKPYLTFWYHIGGKFFFLTALYLNSRRDKMMQATIITKEDLLTKNVGDFSGKLIFKEDLDLTGTHITALPNNLTVEGDLYLVDSNITSLPNNLNVDILKVSNITSILPKGLRVRYFLGLAESRINKLPSDFKGGGKLYLDLSDSQIRHLPENLILRGLNLSGTAIIALPTNLSVSWSLNLSDTQLNNHRLKTVG